MPKVIEAIDEKRLAVLSALFEKDSIKPEISKMSKKTGLKPSEIKNIIKKIETEFGIGHYYPVLDDKKFGFDIVGWVFFQIDYSNKVIFEAFTKRLESITEVIGIYKLIGNGNWNFAFGFATKNLKEFDKLLNEKILTHLLFKSNEFVTNKQYFFYTAPRFKARPRSIGPIGAYQEKHMKKKNPLKGDKRLTQILECILSDEYYRANLRQLHKITNLHPSTIKATINYFFKNKYILKYAPNVTNIEKYKASSFIFDLFSVDFSDEKNMAILKKSFASDNALGRANAIFGDSEHNLVLIHSSPSPEEYLRDFEEKYYAKTRLFGFLKKRTTFFATSLHFEEMGTWPTISRCIMRILVRDFSNKKTE
jgi:DNA-binding Lrp family transcriptional regulator